jgi:hypothetical protein
MNSGLLEVRFAYLPHLSTYYKGPGDKNQH